MTQASPFDTEDGSKERATVLTIIKCGVFMYLLGGQIHLPWCHFCKQKNKLLDASEIFF